MPFKLKSVEKEYRSHYQKGLRDGARAREPESLKEALVELRELRAMVQKQRKRIWFLENKEAMADKQRQRRRAGFEQNVSATLAGMAKRGEIKVNGPTKNKS